MRNQRRSLFQMIFGGAPKTPAATTQLRLIGGYNPTFTSFGDNAYDSDDVRGAVDAIARNAAKLKPKRIRRDKTGAITEVNDSLQYLLAVRPNPFMDAYSFYYKVVTQLFMQNNAFVYVHFDDAGNVTGLYPIPMSSVSLLEYGGVVYAKFNFVGGDYITIEYAELIHLRRHFYRHDLYGEPAMPAIGPTLEVINTTNQGIVNAVKTTAPLRGLLKSQNMLKEEDLKSRKDRFVKDYMSISEGAGGVAALDGTMDYKELTTQPVVVNAAQMKLIDDKVCRYFGVSPEIITSSYTEDQWNAFYSSTIEPLAVQMALQFTSTIFSDREQQVGNEIIFEANRLEYASAQTKIALAQQLLPAGVLTVNEIREIFNMAPIPGTDGDKRLMSLNFIDASKANKYQVGEEPLQKGENQNA